MIEVFNGLMIYIHKDRQIHPEKQFMGSRKPMKTRSKYIE